jgi:hypothetical protein
VESDRAVEEAIALGQTNRRIIQLAANHCSHMTFTHVGGTGIVEVQTGLPIGMRRIDCDFVEEAPASSNLTWIAHDFYREHCVGCPHQDPNGMMPTLGVEVAEAEAELDEAAEERAAATAAAHRAWTARRDLRRDLRVDADPAMETALDDLDVIDADPADDNRPDDATAIGRLLVLAERAPETFSTPVTDHICALVADGVRSPLGVLRRLARTQEPLQQRACDLALGVLAEHPDPEAARLVAEQARHLAPGAMTDEVVASAIRLAGAPKYGSFGHLYDDAGDPTLLRVVADQGPDALTTRLRAMLPPPLPQVDLVLPPGTLTDPSTIPEPDRAAAAASVRHLAATHPQLAESLVGDLVAHLAVDGADRYNELAVPRCQSALATLIVLGVGDVPAVLEAAGTTGSSDLRDRLFGVYERALRIVGEGASGRSGSEPMTTDEDRAAVHDTVMPRVFSHISGRWGPEVAANAAEAIEGLAREDASWAVREIDTITGALLDVAEIISAGPPAGGASLQVVATPDPLASLKAAGQNFARLATANRLANAIEEAALEDPNAVLPRLGDLLDEQRDSERDGEVRWRLLPVLGTVAGRRGDDRAVLAMVLPVLRTYLVDADPSLRARALESWTEVARQQPLPATLVDLLPALIEDRYFSVIRALLNAARRLDWPEHERVQLLWHAVAVADASDPDHNAETLDDAVHTISALTWERPERAWAERVMVKHIGRMDGYKRRDLLSLTWLPETEHGAGLARLRFDQIRAGGLVDRFNVTDDEELVDLLRCGAGLVHLPLPDVIEAVEEFDGQDPRAVLEIVEVIWRAGRVDDALTIIRTLLGTTPNVPANRRLVSLLRLLLAAAEAELAVQTGDDPDPFEQAIAAALPSEGLDDGDNVVAAVGRQAALVTGLRCALRGAQPPAALGAVPTPMDPAEAHRARAARIREISAELVSGDERVTPTAELVRAYGALGVAVSHIFEAEAALLDADATGAATQRHAARLRADAVTEQLVGFGDDDPIASVIRAVAAEVSGGDPVADVAGNLAAIAVPPLFVRGRRTWSGLVHTPEPAPPPSEPAVALFSVDGVLMTGPAVLSHELVYELTVDAWPGAWPEWATTLELNFIGDLRPSDIELPAFTWTKEDMDEDRVGGSGTLQLRFRLAANAAAPRFRVAMRWRGVDGEGIPITEDLDVAGHRELRFRPFDSSRDQLTDYPVVDERLLELYERFRSLGVDEAQLQAFCRLFTATCRIALRFTWDKRFKRGTRVTEKKFHDELFEALLAEPELEGRLERGNALGLGYLDVRHDGVTSELKVERKTAVTQESATKYMGQPTQYAAADGKRLSILCILDMTTKATPVGSPENYVFPLQPALHGLEDPRYPSAVAVLVVNANLPVPSSWSRRKTATLVDAPSERSDCPPSSQGAPRDGDTDPAG